MSDNQQTETDSKQGTQFLNPTQDIENKDGGEKENQTDSRKTTINPITTADIDPTLPDSSDYPLAITSGVLGVLFLITGAIVGFQLVAGVVMIIAGILTVLMIDSTQFPVTSLSDIAFQLSLATSLLVMGVMTILVF